MFELQTAYEYQTDAGIDNQVILLLLETVPINGAMPEQLKSEIKQQHYIEWTDNPDGQKLFWLRLRDELVETPNDSSGVTVTVDSGIRGERGGDRGNDRQGLLQRPPVVE